MRNGQPLVPRTGLEKRNAGADPSRFEGRPKLVESYERTNSIKPAEGQTLEAIEEYGVKKWHSIPKSVGCFAVVTDAEAQFAGLSLKLFEPPWETQVSLPRRGSVGGGAPDEWRMTGEAK